MGNKYNNYHQIIWQFYDNNSVNKKVQNKFKKIFDKIWLNKNSYVIEIWCWKWNFAYFCKSNWVKNYVWFDLDSSAINENKIKFKDYNFYSDDALDYLKINKNKFDFLFMSHVFEHFEIDEAINYSKHFYDVLNEWWTWVNIMPNAWTLFWSSVLRYIDITHKFIHTENSFNQILLSSWFKKEFIYHYNSESNIFLLNIIRRIIKKIIKFYTSFLWYWLERIDTHEFISIIHKK